MNRNTNGLEIRAESLSLYRLIPVLENTALTKDKQINETNFKAVACRILKGVAVKVAGEGGGELIDLFGETVRGLIDDNAARVIEIYKQVTSTKAQK